MFTGIVQEIGSVVSAQSGKLEIAADKVLESIELGGSVAVNGTCLTVTRFDKKSFSVDITPETVKRTNVGNLSAGDRVNLERPLAFGGELGGHLVQGHVDATGTISEIKRDGTASMVKIEAPPEVMQYIVEKGFITIDGVSLTVVDVSDRHFRVSIIDYTGRNTISGLYKAGDMVNLEVDIIAKYAERFSQAQNKGVTADLLKEHGFI